MEFNSSLHRLKVESESRGSGLIQGICSNSVLVETQQKPLVNAMTVDVEDYFQVSAFDPYISRDDWHKFPSRINTNVNRILELFSRYDVKATFFTLGWVADRYPGIVERIVSQGHEIASHGWNHLRVSTLTRNEFAADVRRTKGLLEDLSGTAVKGYRAPSYSINKQNKWAHDVLAEAGYEYSSSIAPIKHDHYGIPDAPRFIHARGISGLSEIPVGTIVFRGENIPCGGGGWFRLYPYRFTKYCVNKINSADRQPCVFYFHPWEIDPRQPRQCGLNFTTRFRHYINLSKTEQKIERLLQDFSWGRMDELFLEHAIEQPSVIANAS